MLYEKIPLTTTNVDVTAGVCWKYENDVSKKLRRMSVGRRSRVHVRTMRTYGYRRVHIKTI